MFADSVHVPSFETDTVYATDPRLKEGLISAFPHYPVPASAKRR
jgi:hypothetical protein